MTDGVSCIEWDEPPGAPENTEWCLGYRALFRLALPRLITIGAIWLAGILVLAGGSIVAGHPLPQALMRGYLLFGAAVAAFVLLGIHIIFIVSRFLYRHVCLSTSEIGYSIAVQNRSFSFSDIIQVQIEPTDNGDRRLVIDGVQGELCRLRVPAGVNIESVAGPIPGEKLIRHDLTQ